MPVARTEIEDLIVYRFKSRTSFKEHKMKGNSPQSSLNEKLAGPIVCTCSTSDQIKCGGMERIMVTN